MPSFSVMPKPPPPSAHVFEGICRRETAASLRSFHPLFHVFYFAPCTLQGGEKVNSAGAGLNLSFLPCHLELF